MYLNLSDRVRASR